MARGQTVGDVFIFEMGETWHCEHCETRITVFVALSEPPMHRCRPRRDRCWPLVRTP